MRADPTRPPSDEKLKELILFIARRSEDDPKFGSVKLNKLLFFSDFAAYARLGTSITGQAYQKLANGPCPKRLIPVKEQLEQNRALAMQERSTYGHTQKRPIALRDADLSLFTGEEIAIVTEVVSALRTKNAKGISTLSHQFAGWELAADRELIPYQMALVKFRKPRKDDKEAAMRMADELRSLRGECPPSDAD